MSMSRDEALKVLADCPKKYLEAAAVVAETQPVEGDYAFNGEESYWEDQVDTTLASLANEFRKLGHASLIEKLTGPIKRITRRKNR